MKRSFLALALGTAVAVAEPLTYQECLLEATRQGHVLSRADIGAFKLECARRFPDSVPQGIG
ncbi:MAG: hypothetical protein KatS3mg121_0241 [Gammaproteobacteria bacterium]|nr:MAG: hypothetical protein KatS3mg121_0241 [Gammaproteobacteria bacterium]